MDQNIEKVLISQEEIIARSKELGEEISMLYQGQKPPILVALLKGSIPFLSELIKHIKLDIEFDYMDVSSYEGTKSLGHIKIHKDLACPIKDENILIVEDIVDTGYTLKEITRMLKDRGAKDVKIVSLLDKPERRLVDVEVDFIGFTIPNEYVIGFGLDYNQKYRNLPYIGVLKREVYEDE